MAEDGAARPIDRSAWIFGLLGLIPFLAPPLAPIAAPGLASAADLCQRVYAGVILAFLAGARFGRALEPGGGRAIALSMAPPLLAAGALAFAGPAPGRALLIAGLLAQGAWDIGAPGLPRGYRRLRAVLSAGAVLGLAAGYDLL